MRILLQKHTWYTVIVAAIFIIGSIWFLSHKNSQNTSFISATVESGSVTETVSASGFVEAKNTAELGFPSTGKVTEVFVEEGDTVETGEVLATVATLDLVAERNKSVAALKSAEADLNAAINGAAQPDLELASTKVENAEENLARTITEEEIKVANAKKTLLSNQLEALSTDPGEDAVAPTVTGTFNCEAGTYNLNVYRSGSDSGYAYRLSGIENDTLEAFVDNPGPLGECGLYIQFDSAGNYNQSNWVIEIPNKKASNYVTYKNAYDLALEQRNNAIATAEAGLTLASEEANVVSAETRGETIAQKRAAVDQARAQVSSIDAKIADRSIVAPFSGVITNVDIVPGEVATQAAVITLLAEDAFELTARIPEIDITKVQAGQSANIVFDAQASEIVTGHIKYVSPLAVEIDGVAYFETTIELEEKPTWMKSGLNADVDIFITELTNATRLPKRFVDLENKTVQKYIDGKEKTLPVEIVFIGNDGYVAIEGLTVGEEVISP